MKLCRLFFLPILLLLAACGTTVTPAAPTAVPATVAASTLSESAVVQDMLGGELSVKHPAGWATKSEAEAIRLLLATSADLLDNATVTLAPGQLQLVISATPLELAGGALPEGAALSPKTFLEALLVQVKTASPTLTADAVTETTLAGNTAAHVKASAPERDVLLVVVANSEAYVLSIATTAKGELVNQQALIMEIAASADYVKAAE